jgi:ABC-2 type transport system permease protein
VLVGLVATYVTSKPRVALVDRAGLPATFDLAGHRFHVNATIREVSRNVHLVRLSRAEANRELQNGKVVATLTVPPGFVADLKGMVQSPQLILQTSHGTISARVDQQVQALVYTLNRLLQEAYIKNNLGYVTLILHGGNGKFLGRQFNVLGLDRAERMLGRLPPSPAVKRIRDFIGDAHLALAYTGSALRATANPIRLVRARSHGRTWALSAQVQSFALALTISFLALMLAAGSLAAERDENVIGRLRRGLVTQGQLVWAKTALAAVVALVLGLAIALAFGLIVTLGNVVGGEPWGRLPLVVLGLLAAGGALGALGSLIGALAREARSASLVALLLVLPIVFIGLVPREVAPVAGWISDAFPFAHAVRYFGSALYDASPWTTLWQEGLWLLGLGGVFGLAARLGMRRLSV